MRKQYLIYGLLFLGILIPCCFWAYVIVYESGISKEPAVIINSMGDKNSIIIQNTDLLDHSRITDSTLALDSLYIPLH
jgi:hypothetical protein